MGQTVVGSPIGDWKRWPQTRCGTPGGEEKVQEVLWTFLHLSILLQVLA